jgi:ADP-heptose:LPS heptosyltransferase
VKQRFLAVKLADLGDVLTITPALRALRQTYPEARVDALVTPVGAATLAGLDSVDRTITFEKSRFDCPSPAIGPVIDALRLGIRLRRGHYDRVFLFHHLFTAAGRVKYRALLAAIGAPWRAGVAEKRPSFLNAAVVDRGYGVQHEADYWLDVVGLAGVSAENPRFELAIAESDRQQANALLGDADHRPARRIALFPGSGAYSVARRWPLERFFEVGRQLSTGQSDAARSASAEILVLGGEDERDLAETVARTIGPAARSLAGRTSLKVLGAILERCDLLVGNDGGVMHVAVSVGTPVVAIFGPTNAMSWGPYGGVDWRGAATPVDRPIVVSRQLLCSPCHYRGFLPGTPRGCRARDCLTLTTVDTVVDAANHLLSGRRRLAL